MNDIKQTLYTAVVKELLEHEFDINKDQGRDRGFTYEIKSNFDIEYTIYMTWLWGMKKKTMSVGRINPRQVLEKISKLKDFRQLKSYESDDNDEIIRVICASYALWRLGLKINFGGIGSNHRYTEKGSISEEKSWRDLFNFERETPKKTLKAMLIEENPEFELEFKRDPIEAITFNF